MKSALRFSCCFAASNSITDYSSACCFASTGNLTSTLGNVKATTPAEGPTSDRQLAFSAPASCLAVDLSPLHYGLQGPFNTSGYWTETGGYQH